MRKKLMIASREVDWSCGRCKKARPGGVIGFVGRGATTIPEQKYLCFFCLIELIKDGTFELIVADKETEEAAEPTTKSTTTTEDGTIVLDSQETTTTEFVWS